MTLGFLEREPQDELKTNVTCLRLLSARQHVYGRNQRKAEFQLMFKYLLAGCN